MLNKQDASRIKPLTENRESLEALAFYVDLRIKLLTESLLYVNDMGQVNKIQGAVAELKRFLKLREEVNNPKEEING